MRWRPLTWLLLSAACFLGAAYFWRLGNEWRAQRTAVPSNAPAAAPSNNPSASPVTNGAHAGSTIAESASVQDAASADSNIAHHSAANALLKYRLHNTR